jgi:hypothetical protein
MRWVNEYSPETAKKVHPHLKPVNDSWRTKQSRGARSSVHKAMLGFKTFQMQNRRHCIWHLFVLKQYITPNPQINN